MTVRWRNIPGWMDGEYGYQLSDCGRIRDTQRSTRVYNDWDEVIDIQYEEVEFEPFHIFLYMSIDGEWQEEWFTFDELRKAVAEGRPPVPKGTNDLQAL